MKQLKIPWLDLKTFQKKKPLTRKSRRHDTFDPGA